MLGENIVCLRVGVGSHPPTISPVGSTHRGGWCSQNEAVKTEPREVGGSSLDRGSLDVFGEHAPGLNLSHDTEHFGPQARGPDASAACGRERLTRESAGDDIGVPTEWPSVESADVVPDREVLEASILLPGVDDVPASRVNLTPRDGAPSKHSGAQNSTTSPEEKCQLTHSPSRVQCDR